jgi:hypothetical protein
MKPIFIRLLAFLTPLTLAEVSSAQNSTPALAFNSKATNSAAAGYVAAEADLKALTELKALSPKLFERFAKDYKTATNIKVYAGKTVQINSKVDGILNRTFYTRKGKFMHNIRHYESPLLPETIVNSVNDAFPRFEIFGGVAEVTIQGKTAYFVLIENKINWKRLMVVNGEVTIYEEFVKTREQRLSKK